MSSPDVECVKNTQNDFSLPSSVSTVASENGGNNGTNTIIVETYETPKSLSSPVKLSSANNSTPATISPPCTLTLKSSNSSLMAETKSVNKDFDLPPEGDVKLMSMETDSDKTIPNKALVDDALTPAADLLKWKDMPRHLQFNRYIVEGYRPLTDAKGCVHSLFYFHNETVNILTHGNIIDSRLISYFLTNFSSILCFVFHYLDRFLYRCRHSCTVHSCHRSVLAALGRLPVAVLVPSARHASSVVWFVCVPPVHESGPRRSGVLSIA